MRRERLTWTAGRAASAPPAVPGYGTEDQDHPAHQPDPDHEDYADGDPDAWAETPNPPPYAEGNPPADPGYDSEDQDHPAYVRKPRVPKEARGLQASILAMAEAKAGKCLRLASVMFAGRRGVTAQMVEDQAFDMMDWSDEQIDDSLDRLGGGFLAEEEMLEDDADVMADDFGMPPPDDTLFVGDDELDALLAEDDMEDVAPEGKTSEVELLAAQVKALTDELEALKGGSKKADVAPEETFVPEEEAGLFAQSDEMGNPVVMSEEDAILDEIFGCKTAKDEGEEEVEEEEKVEKEAKKAEDDEEIEPEEEEEKVAKKAKKAEDDEIELEEDEEKVAKTASQRPQPRKPSKGISRVGSVTRQVNGGEVAELSKLWESAPDVSSVFNGK